MKFNGSETAARRESARGNHHKRNPRVKQSAESRVLVQSELSNAAAALLQTDFNISLIEAQPIFAAQSASQPDPQRSPADEPASGVEPEEHPSPESSGEQDEKSLNEKQLRIRLELEQKKSRQYQLLLDHIPQPLLFISPDLFIVKHANLAASNLLGVEQSRLRGMPLLLFVDHKHRSDFRTYVLSLLSEQPATLPCALRLSGKRECRVLIGGAAILDENRLTGLLITLYPEA